MPSYFTGKLGLTSALCVIVAIALAVEGKGAAALVVGVFGVLGCFSAWRRYERESGRGRRPD